MKRAVLAALLLLPAPPAAAAPLDVRAALTLSALDGSHQINGGDVARIDFVPLPLIELSVRRGRDSVQLEGLPPVALRYGAGTVSGSQTTRLSIGNLSLRRALGGGLFAGLGQTLYNQHTTYAVTPGARYTRLGSPPIAIAGAEEQYSRVTGLRLEAGGRWRSGAGWVEASAALNPAMHGVQYTFIPRAGIRGPTFADPERATQLDLALRAARPLAARAELLYGLRYIHYSGRYDAFPGQLADRNVGLAPVLGYRIRL